VLRDEAAAALAQRPSSYGADWLPWLQARLELASGSPAQARQTMEATWAALDGMGARWGLRAFGVDLVRAEREAGDVAAARRYADRLAELADTMTAPSAHASAARGRALAYLDVAAAEDAVRFAERSGRPLELAHTYEDAAATLLHAGSPERAGELLSAALSIAEQLQARATADRVVGAMRELNPANPAPRVRPVRAASGWDSLTKTEHEVVRRVAEGHTNREVAELLFISRYTVETHLKRIFTKVGVRSRTELAHRYATWAATRH
jgi:DNA-binding CsgD family transcriptional regulator